jgi:3-oxoacyl-[acyl-carrier protein] reductase
MRTIVVTGASKGLGFGITRRLCASGYRVIAIARNETDELVGLRDALTNTSPRLEFRQCDLAEIAGLPNFVRSIHKEFGAIYGLVNNAAIGTSGMLASAKNRDIEYTVRLNTLAPIVLTKYVIRAMMSGQGGRVVNIASIVGATGFSGLSVYGATKTSMLGFTRSLARELGPLNITVNAVAPGFVDSDMTAVMTTEQRDRILRRSPLRRFAQIDDVAAAVEFLISDKAKSITGTVLTIDAGSTA